ncbi:MAG: ERF family protein [Terracidiphilus sp.]
MRHSESVAALAKALAAAQAEYVTVPKSKTAKVKMKSGGEFSYNYADLADCLSMALPRLSKHGIAFSQPHVIFPDGKLRVVTFLLHESGEWMESDGIEISEEGDPQQFGAEATYFRRYDGCSLIGVAPDEDTDAQQAGNRTRRTTPAQATENPFSATSHQPAGAPTAAQGAQPPTDGPKSSPAASQPQQRPSQQEAAGALQGDGTQPAVRFIPPNGLTCIVKGVIDIPQQGRTRPHVVVTFQGAHRGVSIAYCFDTKLWKLLHDSVGLECHFQIEEKDKNEKHFINIADVIYVDGVEFVDGKPVTQGA